MKSDWLLFEGKMETFFKVLVGAATSVTILPYFGNNINFIIKKMGCSDHYQIAVPIFFSIYFLFPVLLFCFGFLTFKEASVDASRRKRRVLLGITFSSMLFVLYLLIEVTGYSYSYEKKEGIVLVPIIICLLCFTYFLAYFLKKRVDQKSNGEKVAIDNVKFKAIESRRLPDNKRRNWKATTVLILDYLSPAFKEPIRDFVILLSMISLVCMGIYFIKCEPQHILILNLLPFCYFVWFLFKIKKGSTGLRNYINKVDATAINGQDEIARKVYLTIWDTFNCFKRGRLHFIFSVVLCLILAFVAGQSFYNAYKKDGKDKKTQVAVNDVLRAWNYLEDNMLDFKKSFDELTIRSNLNYQYQVLNLSNIDSLVNKEINIVARDSFSGIDTLKSVALSKLEPQDEVITEKLKYEHELLGYTDTLNLNIFLKRNEQFFSPEKQDALGRLFNDPRLASMDTKDLYFQQLWFEQTNDLNGYFFDFYKSRILDLLSVALRKLYDAGALLLLILLLGISILWWDKLNTSAAQSAKGIRDQAGIEQIVLHRNMKFLKSSLLFAFLVIFPAFQPITSSTLSLEASIWPLSISSSFNKKKISIPKPPPAVNTTINRTYDSVFVQEPFIKDSLSLESLVNDMKTLKEGLPKQFGLIEKYIIEIGPEGYEGGDLGKNYLDSIHQDDYEAYQNLLEIKSTPKNED